jgi:hypothetical protein
MMERLVGKLARLQRKSGNLVPRVRQSVRHGDDPPRAGGGTGRGGGVPAGTAKRGSAALKSTRDGRGLFSYEYPGRGGAVEGAAGRMPFLEHVLTFSGQATADSVKASIEVSFKHHALLERIRKYDDHADAFQNGGFFFWYDQYGRALAAKGANDDASLEKQRAIVLATPEIDGAWVGFARTRKNLRHRDGPAHPEAHRKVSASAVRQLREHHTGTESQRISSSSVRRRGTAGGRPGREVARIRTTRSPAALRVSVPLWCSSDPSRFYSRANFGERLEVVVLVLPGGVHHADDALHLRGRFEPLLDPRRVVIVVARQDLLVAPVGEERQVLLAGTEVPVHDDDVLGEPFPGSPSGPL